MLQISVITPCYNAERYIGSTLESVRAQSIAEWELIAVDDGCTDASAAVVERSARDEKRLKLIRKTNGGVSSARNAGFRAAAATSRYLLFLDADDCLEPTMLETMSSYLDQHPDVGMVYCAHTVIDENGNPAEAGPWTPRLVPAGARLRELPPDHAETPFVSIFTLAGLIPSIALMRRSIYEQTPGWDESLGHIYEDTDMFLQLALRSKIHYLPQPLVRYRRHGAQSTADPQKVAAQERKLYAKWSRMDGLTADQQSMLDEAWRFREGRVLPLVGFRDASAHLAKGEVGVALRFYAGAARRYLASWRPGARG